MKKARHPVELSHILRLGITPVIPHDPDARTYHFCFLFWNFLFLMNSS
ncbi:hypothetical protein J500_2932 [Acinetobacter sp. 479375]|nr:hypothetical protein J500_2932 [Acinetobacter sp. 479375]